MTGRESIYVSMSRVLSHPRNIRLFVCDFWTERVVTKTEPECWQRKWRKTWLHCVHKRIGAENGMEWGNGNRRYMRNVARKNNWKQMNGSTKKSIRIHFWFYFLPVSMFSRPLQLSQHSRLYRSSNFSAKKTVVCLVDTLSSNDKHLHNLICLRKRNGQLRLAWHCIEDRNLHRIFICCTIKGFSSICWCIEAVLTSKLFGNVLHSVETYLCWVSCRPTLSALTLDIRYNHICVHRHHEMRKMKI